MIAELTFWEWAQRQGYSLNDLGAKLGYSPEHLSRLKNGRVPITVDFSARCVFAFGDSVRQFFLTQMSVASDVPTTSSDADRAPDDAALALLSGEPCPESDR